MSTISWREQVAFDGMIMMSTLYQITRFAGFLC